MSRPPNYRRPANPSPALPGQQPLEFTGNVPDPKAEARAKAAFLRGLDRFENGALQQVEHVRRAGYFSLVKRVSSGFCWSRGRPRKDAAGNPLDNAEAPCVAWQNETLCKLIYVNLRLIVQYEIATGTG